MSSSSTEVQLLGSGVSPFEWRIIWALKWKGVDFEFIQEDVSNKSSLLLEKNPVYKMIPVLIHGRNSVSESLIILEYIDETWKENPILPADPTERAHARFWAKFSEDKITEPIKQAFHCAGEKQAEGVKALGEGLDILEGKIRGKKFFGGDSFGYLDIVVGWISYWLHFNQEAAGYNVMDQERYPGIDQWMKNFLEVEIIKENLPPSDEMMSSYIMYREMSLAFLNSNNKSD
ncbi:Glutathione S-transferase U7 [Sesamum alatum]|uniref:Glutathione S-transferase n=1 Tax=Sesamum alatum TaxID=300844 RepID=A0AAE2CJN3_9LAMI|nr:Glutathione S-transferase U7 [Sesamum alatum]